MVPYYKSPPVHLPGAPQPKKTRCACLGQRLLLSDPGVSHTVSEVGKFSVAALETPTPRQSAPGTGQWPVAAGWTDSKWPVQPFQSSCCFLVGWWGSLQAPQLVRSRLVSGSPAMGPSSLGRGWCLQCLAALLQGQAVGAPCPLQRGVCSCVLLKAVEGVRCCHGPQKP